MEKTIAERLRKFRIDGDWLCLGCFIAQLTGEDEPSCPTDTGDRLACHVCYESQFRKLGAAMEAELNASKSRELTEGVNVDALLNVADDLEGYSDEYLPWAIPTERRFKGWADAIRKAVKRPKPDTLESVVEEMLADFDANADNGMEIDGYIERFRKLLGGER